MKLTGSQYKLFTEALLSAFPSQPDLSWMVRTRLNQNLEAIAKGDNLRDIVSNLIKWAEADGQTNELLNAACQEKPGNPELKAFAEKLKLEQREAEPKTTPDKTDESGQPNNPTLHQIYLRRLVERIGTLNLAQINPDQSRGINLEEVYVDSPTPLTLSVEVKNWRVIDWWLTRTDQPTPNPDRNRTEPPRDKPEKFGYQNAPFETLIAKLNTEIE
ncbi:MAG: effector-associated domain EAD1-containing protein, partial [Chloroflexota bacterium]